MNIQNDQVIPSIDFFSFLVAQAYSKMKVPGWFREHEKLFSHMNWPPQNPDNPIENLAQWSDSPIVNSSYW